MKRFILLVLLICSSFLAYAQTTDEQALLNAARTAFQNDPRDAGIIRKLEKVVELNPTSTDAYYLMALSAIERNVHDYAEGYMDKAIAIDSLNADFYMLRARSNMIETTDTTNYTKALYDLDKVLTLTGAAADVYKKKATICRQMATTLYYESNNKVSALKRSQYYAGLTLSYLNKLNALQPYSNYKYDVKDLEKLIARAEEQKKLAK